jgi:hypothetical protein
MKRGNGCLTALPLLFFGALLTIVGVGLLISASSRRSESISAEGVVVELIASSGSDGTTYAPVIEYVGPDGKVYRFTSNLYRSPAPDVGDSIGVLINPDDPSDASENSIWLLYVFPGIALLFGLPLMGAGIFLSRRGLKRGSIDLDSRQVVVPGAPKPSLPSGTTPAPTSVYNRTVAQFRRVEPRGPDASGNFEYRVVAYTDDSVAVFSDWLRTDPTTAMLMNGISKVAVEWRDGHGRVVDVPQ